MSVKENAIRIVIDSEASVAEAYAADQLERHLRMIPNCRSLRGEVTEDDSFALIVGNSAGRGAATTQFADLNDEEIEILSVDNRSLIVRGGGPRGTLYAVYEFLERLGFRWFAPDDTLVPLSLSIPTGSVRVKPDFWYRDAYWFNAANHPEWASRNRLNGQLCEIPAKMGGGLGWSPFVHSFGKIIPPDQYAATNPEYFSFRRGQGRVTEGAQLCLANPDVFDLTVEFVLAKMADPSVSVVDVSQNDCESPCQCPECAAIDRRAGSHAGAMLDFCNRVAEATSKNYPDKFVGTLAYTYTSTPPKGMRAHPNVIVRLCHMGFCDLHPLADCERNRPFVDLLSSWRNHCDHLHVWHYVTNFQNTLLFHPCFNAVAKDIRFYRDHGVEGLFLQGYPSEGVALADVHAYAMARCLWNADRDYMAEVADFVRAHYGPAGGAIMDVIEIMEESSSRRCRSVNVEMQPHEGLYSRSQIERATERVNAAFQSTEDPKRLKRLKPFRMWMNYADVTAVPALRKTTGGFAVEAAPDAPAKFAELTRTMDELGVEVTCEFPQSHQDLSERFGWSLNSGTIPVFALENERLRVEICPELGGMVSALLDKNTDTNPLVEPAPWILGYPYMGGVMLGVEANGKTIGFRQPHHLVEARCDDSQITLAAKLADGLRIRRTFRLDDACPGLRVEAEIVNDSPAIVEAAFHSFIIVGVGELNDVRMFKTPNTEHRALNTESEGEIVSLENAFEARPGVSMAQWVSLSGAEAPAGCWGLFNDRQSVGIVERFDAPAAFCGSNAYARDQRVLMETLWKETTLKPGERSTLNMVYEIIDASFSR